MGYSPQGRTESDMTEASERQQQDKMLHIPINTGRECRGTEEPLDESERGE